MKINFILVAFLILSASAVAQRIPAAIVTNFALLSEAAPDAALIDELVDAVMLPALLRTATSTA